MSDAPSGPLRTPTAGAGHPSAHHRPRPALAVGAVVAAFVVSRLAYAAAGVRFRFAHAYAYLQFIDAPLLRHDLVTSLWYDHTQPPGLNLLWATVLRISPDHPDRVLWPVFLVCGLATALLMHRLLLRLGARPSLAMGAAIVWAVSPTTVLVETYLLYTPFEVLALLGMAVLLARWTDTARMPAVAGALVVAAALALTRSTFHLVWVLGVVAVAVLVRRDRWRTVLAAAAVPVLVVVGLYAKNLVLFDSFGASTWLGQSLGRITVEQLDPDERAALVADGTLSPYAAHRSFSSFEEMGIEPPGRTEPGPGVAVLEQHHRTGSRFANLRQRDYIDVNAALAEDAGWVVRHRPGTYLRGVGRSASTTATAPSAWFGYGNNRDEIAGAVAVERTLLGAWEDAPGFFADRTAARPGQVQWVVVAAYLLVLPATGAVLVRRRAWQGGDGGLAAVGFLWGTTLYLTGLTVLIEYGETSRFRTVTDACVLVLGAWLASLVLDRRRRRRSAVAGPDPVPEPG